MSSTTESISAKEDDEVDDMEEGDEPGASSDQYLVAVEPLEDLDNEPGRRTSSMINGTFPGHQSSRHNSTIHKIKKEIKKQRTASVSSALRETLQSRDSFASLDGDNSSSAVSETESDCDLGTSQQPMINDLAQMVC